MHPFREVQTPERNYGPGRIGGREVTPLARRLAGERGIDLSRVSGSGPYGRIVARDLENVSPARATLDGGPTAAQIKAMFEGVVYEEVRLEAARVTRARRLVEAQQTIPHFYLTADVEIGRVLAFCDEANLSASGSGGEPAFMLSPGDFIVKMWGAALQRVPEANAAWAEDRALRFRSSDIAVAIALGGGIVTPVLRAVETKSVSIISAELKALASDRAPETSECPSSATVLYNLGTDGVRELSAIINPPQTTVLAIGAPRRVPVEREDGSVRFVSQMTATLTCDHRVIDAALGVRLLTAFKSFVENPVTALV